MSSITTLVLLLVAYVFWQGGQVFFAFLAVMVAVLLALTPSKKAPSAPAGYPQGYPAPVMVGGGAQIPNVMKIKIKPAWGDTTNLEDWAFSMGKAVNTIGRTIAWVLRGFKTPK
ncbi:MAG: hypothetical protein NTY90_05370 [Candidatus Micrarchaeota archaeon]|nr:hypothetical protein [Candidatus Micrarchaeota archaeon]